MVRLCGLWIMVHASTQQQHVRRWPVHVPHASGLWTLDGTLHAVEHRMPCTHVLVTQGRVREHSRAPAPKRPYSFSILQYCNKYNYQNDS